MSNKLITKAYIKDVEEEGVIQVAIASDGIIDREGESIDPEGWEFKNFMKNPMLLWGHNSREYRPPIGKVVKLWFEGDGDKKTLMFTPKFDMKDKFAVEIYRKMKDGFLNAFSVGFIPMEQDGTTYTKSELIEISAVAVPANPNALVQLRGMGVEPVKWDECTIVDGKCEKQVADIGEEETDDKEPETDEPQEDETQVDEPTPEEPKKKKVAKKYTLTTKPTSVGIKKLTIRGVN